jgi:hypothetical protein
VPGTPRKTQGCRPSCGDLLGWARCAAPRFAHCMRDMPVEARGEGRKEEKATHRGGLSDVERWLEENGLYCPRLRGRVSKAACFIRRTQDSEGCRPCLATRERREVQMARKDICRECLEDKVIKARGLCIACYSRERRRERSRRRLGASGAAETPKLLVHQSPSPSPAAPPSLTGRPSAGSRLAREKLADLLLSFARKLGGERWRP